VERKSDVVRRIEMINRDRKDTIPITSIFVLGLVFFLLLLGGPLPAFSQKGKPAAVPAGPDPWPKSADLNGTRYTIYQPQLDTWDGYRFEAHAAVSVLPRVRRNRFSGSSR
jgi:hypothetical protein